MILYKVKYLLFHVIISVYNFNAIDLEFTSGYRLVKFLVRVVTSLYLKFAIYNKRLEHAN
jgi:hypothetical protein